MHWHGHCFVLAAHWLCMGCSLDLNWIAIGWPSASNGSSLDFHSIFVGHTLDSNLELYGSFVGFPLDFAVFHWMPAGSRRTSSDFRWIVFGEGRAGCTGSDVALVCVALGLVWVRFHTIPFKKDLYTCSDISQTVTMH